MRVHAGSASSKVIIMRLSVYVLFPSFIFIMCIWLHERHSWFLLAFVFLFFFVSVCLSCLHVCMWESVSKTISGLVTMCFAAEPCIIAFARRGRTFLLVFTSILSACPQTPWVMTEDGPSRLDWASCAVTFGKMSFCGNNAMPWYPHIFAVLQ